MGVMGRCELMALALVALFSSAVATFAGYDGLPRPSGFTDAPTTTLGAKPAVDYNGKSSNCIWYSWENYAYDPTETKNCSTSLWAWLNANPSGLGGFEYYTPLNGFYDPAYQQYLCVLGCFAGGGPAATGGVAVAAVSRVAVTPVVAPVVAPAVSPPKPPSTPPPVMAPPPPATLFRPPPPTIPQAPSTIVSPTPSTVVSPTPSTVVSPTPSSIIPPTASGPALAPGSVTQLSAATALRTFFSTTLFVLVGVALVLNL